MEIKVGQYWEVREDTNRHMSIIGSIVKILRVTTERISYKYVHKINREGQKLSLNVSFTKPEYFIDHYKINKAYNTPLYKVLNNE